MVRERTTSKKVPSTGWSGGLREPGSLQAGAQPTNAAAREEGGASQPFPSGAPAAPPLGTL